MCGGLICIPFFYCIASSNHDALSKCTMCFTVVKYIILIERCCFIKYGCLAKYCKIMPCLLLRDNKEQVMDNISYVMGELHFYFVVRQELPGGQVQLSLSSHAPFNESQTVMPFDEERDAALYLLDECRKGAIVSEKMAEIAEAIIRGEEPMFVYEENLSDGTLLLSLHNCLPPVGSNIAAFGSRAAKQLARFILRRLHESSRVRATEETMRQVYSLLD